MKLNLPSLDAGIELNLPSSDVEHFCHVVCWAIHSGRGAVPATDGVVISVLNALSSIGLEDGRRAKVMEEFLVERGVATIIDGKLALTEKGVGLAVRYGLEHLAGDALEEDED